MTENKFELQSYFILYLLFVRILNLSKDIVSFLHISKRFWPNYWKMKVCYEVYSFELNLLIIHLRNYEAFFFALCLYLQKNIEFVYFQFVCSWTNVILKNMVVYDVLTFLQTKAFVCSTCGKAYSTNQNLARGIKY
jgi:hypothetical protein